MSPRRDTRAARRFFTTVLNDHGEPTEVNTDRAWTLLAVVEEILPAASHDTSRYANNRIEAEHGRLNARLLPMPGLKRDHSARVIVRGHAGMENIRRNHYELGLRKVLDFGHPVSASRDAWNSVAGSCWPWACCGSVRS